jgi:hypothetical protein
MDFPAAPMLSSAPRISPVRRLLLLSLTGLACLLALVSPARVESTHLKIIVGLTDDTGKWLDRQEGIVGVHVPGAPQD